MWPFCCWERNCAFAFKTKGLHGLLTMKMATIWPFQISESTLQKTQLHITEYLYISRQFSTAPMISIDVKHVGCTLLMWLCAGRPQYEINYTSRGVLNNATHDDLHMTRSLWLLRDVPSGNYHSLLFCNDDI